MHDINAINYDILANDPQYTPEKRRAFSAISQYSAIQSQREHDIEIADRTKSEVNLIIKQPQINSYLPQQKDVSLHLWHGTEYGMTVEQVKTVLPNVISPLDSSQLSNGAKELLRLEEITILNNKFSVSFFFNVDILKHVMLTLKDVDEFHKAKAVFVSLAEALQKKYGPAIEYETGKQGYLNIGEARWRSGATSISLLVFSVEDYEPTLNINYTYTPSVAYDTDKL